MLSNTLKYFNEICKIPHVSGNEQKLIKYITNLFDENNISYETDKVGNIYAYKNSNSQSNPILLQAHMDMVGVKDNTSNHDFNINEIKTYEENG
jgi:dipeptidase D